MGQSSVKVLTMGLSTGWTGLVAALCGLVTVASAGVMMDCHQPASDTGTIYDFSLLDLHQTKDISLSDYRGKVVLIVNLATY